jgi:hypothetical protein
MPLGLLCAFTPHQAVASEHAPQPFLDLEKPPGLLELDQLPDNPQHRTEVPRPGRPPEVHAMTGV